MIKGMERKADETEDEYDIRMEDLTERLDQLAEMMVHDEYSMMDWEHLRDVPEDRTQEWVEGLADALSEIDFNIKFWISMRCLFADVIARLDQQDIPICNFKEL